MPTFRVILYESGRAQALAYRNVVAPSAKKAAEAVAGEKLISIGTQRNHRARAWEINLPSSTPMDFYRDTTPKSDHAAT